MHTIPIAVSKRLFTVDYTGFINWIHVQYSHKYSRTEQKRIDSWPRMRIPMPIATGRDVQFFLWLRRTGKLFASAAKLQRVSGCIERLQRIGIVHPHDE